MNYPIKRDDESWTDYQARCITYEEYMWEKADYEVEESLIERHFD